MVSQFYYYLLANKKEKLYNTLINSSGEKYVALMVSPLLSVFIFYLIVTLSTQRLIVDPFVFTLFFLSFLHMAVVGIVMSKSTQYQEKIEEEKERLEKVKKDLEKELYKEYVRERVSRINNPEDISKLIEEELNRIFREGMAREKVIVNQVDQNTINALKLMDLSKDCTIEEIKKRYRKLSLAHHPDRGGLEENFKKLNKAYKHLLKVKENKK